MATITNASGTYVQDPVLQPFMSSPVQVSPPRGPNPALIQLEAPTPFKAIIAGTMTATQSFNFMYAPAGNVLSSPRLMSFVAGRPTNVSAGLRAALTAAGMPIA
jgi:hypothetical protein